MKKMYYLIIKLRILLLIMKNIKVLIIQDINRQTPKNLKTNQITTSIILTTIPITKLKQTTKTLNLPLPLDQLNRS